MLMNSVDTSFELNGRVSSEPSIVMHFTGLSTMPLGVWFSAGRGDSVEEELDIETKPSYFTRLVCEHSFFTVSVLQRFPKGVSEPVAAMEVEIGSCIEEDTIT